MGNPIENALRAYKAQYSWDKDLVADTEDEIEQIKTTLSLSQAELVIKKKEQILL